MKTYYINSLNSKRCFPGDVLLKYRPTLIENKSITYQKRTVFTYISFLMKTKRSQRFDLQT